MHASLVPTANDLAGLVGYVLGNPYLFISSSTVMTTGLVLGAVAVSMVPRSAPIMRVVAPPLAMLLVYFGVGSLVLASEILVRFHDTIPDATETQFASGIGHLLEAAAGIAVLTPHLRFQDGDASGCQMLMLEGALAHDRWKGELLSYEAPPYFGMLCASYAR